MTRLSVSINESDYNTLISYNCNISDICRRELNKVRLYGLEKCVELIRFEPLTHTPKHRLSVNLYEVDPNYYYDAPYKLPFVIRCIISQYVDNLRRHE